MKGVDWKKSGIKRSDFRTKVEFVGVDEFRMRNDQEVGDRYYRSAEIGKRKGKNTLRIEYASRSGHGWLDIVFDAVEVENIAPRIRPCLPRGTDTTRLLYYLPSVGSANRSKK
jgi:hypothetical protein